MTAAGYGPCPHCGQDAVQDMRPSFLPLGTDAVLEVIDQECRACGLVWIGPYQKTRMVRSQALHDRLVQALSQRAMKK